MCICTYTQVHTQAFRKQRSYYVCPWSRATLCLYVRVHWKCIMCILGKFKCLERDNGRLSVSDQETLGKAGHLLMWCGWSSIFFLLKKCSGFFIPENRNIKAFQSQPCKGLLCFHQTSRTVTYLVPWVGLENVSWFCKEKRNYKVGKTMHLISEKKKKRLELFRENMIIVKSFVVKQI